MSEIRQKMRGSTATLNSYVGSEGQLLVDLSRLDLRVYDGVVAGGVRIPNFTYTEATYLKQSGGGITGNLTVTGSIDVASALGGVGVTSNDGYGDANLAFNHTNGIPSVDGSSGRITVNVTEDTDVVMQFLTKSGVTNGVATGLNPLLTLTEDGAYVHGDLHFTGAISTDSAFVFDQIVRLGAGLSLKTLSDANQTFLTEAAGLVSIGSSNFAGIKAYGAWAFQSKLTILDGTSAAHAVSLAQLETYLPLSGGVVDGDIVVRRASPQIRLVETDAPAGSQVQGVHMFAGTMRISNFSDAGTYYSSPYQFDRDASDLSSVTSVLTRAAGDGRYGQLASENTWAESQSFSEQIVMSNGSALVPAIRGGDSDSGIYFGGSYTAITVNGEIATRFDPQGAGMPVSYSSATRESGDERWGQLEVNNTWTGSENIFSVIRVNEVRMDNGSSGDPSMTFEDAQTTGFYRSSTTGRVIASHEGTNAALIDEPGTSMGDGISLVTREKGDARYASRAIGQRTSDLSLTSSNALIASANITGTGLPIAIHGVMSVNNTYGTGTVVAYVALYEGSTLRYTGLAQVTEAANAGGVHKKCVSCIGLSGSTTEGTTYQIRLYARDTSSTSTDVTDAAVMGS